MASNNEQLKSQILDAGINQRGHFVLHSGRHSMDKLDMERLLARQDTLREVMYGVMDIMHGLYAKTMVPVPNGALRLARPSFPLQVFRIIGSTKNPDGQGFALRSGEEHAISRADKIVIFDDVVTTGGSALQLADTVGAVNPEAELHLAGIWRRGELSPETNEIFASQSFLVEQPLPDWPEADCVPCNET